MVRCTCCKDCENRHIGCHSTCESYNDYRKEKDEENAKIREKIRAETDYIDSQIIKYNKILKRERRKR